jgi:hypothetical protein
MERVVIGLRGCWLYSIAVLRWRYTDTTELTTPSNWACRGLGWDPSSYHWCILLQCIAVMLCACACGCASGVDARIICMYTLWG